MALPIIPLIAVAALVGLALHKSTHTTVVTTPTRGAPGPGGESTATPTGTVTLPPITITGAAADTPAAQNSGGSVAPWNPQTMVIPAPSDLKAIPGNYAAQSQETVAVQTALNNWASAVGFQASDSSGANFIPLKEDGLYGPNTRLVAGAFQTYENAVKNAGLAVDGLAGPQTQTYLGDWATITKPSSGGY